MAEADIREVVNESRTIGYCLSTFYIAVLLVG